MGLSAPRKRAKFSQDPNNTAWSRSSARFGEKLLLSQGWTPGSTLGANCASYIDNPASISHIRITVKDNNLGLGAKNGAHCDDNPTTGLDGLQNLLGRLNGKDEELLEKEHRSREASRRTIYAERRWGFDNFRSGGFLVGDRVHFEEAEKREVFDSATSVRDVVPKAGITDQGLEKEEMSGRESEIKALHNRSNLAPRARSTANFLDEKVPDEGGGRQAKWSRASDDDTLEAQQRLEKLERKAQRRARKAEKLAAKASKQKGQRSPDPLPPQIESMEQESVAETGSAHRSHGRHAVRQRFIQHKKMSLANQKALNEILMIRA
ncbi:MAG: hypothetical protein LQ343_004740 [Gyalolechia ehrenbergii]|nr:MAG: hypothetical protein LQ343_004740 [Gyalolechia ehrenbergii]